MTLCRKAYLVMAVTGALMLPALSCLAAEGGGFDRRTWDISMRLVNFAILAFVIFKYGKAPLVNFLASKRAGVILSLEELEKQREELAQQQQEQDGLFARMDEKLGSIKEYYHRLGQDEKEKIMARAKLSREHMLEDAQQRADREFERAKMRFRQEVVDLAVQLAEERIRRHINEEDQKVLVDGYVGQLGALRQSNTGAKAAKH